jgi:hypothetical protein
VSLEYKILGELREIFTEKFYQGTVDDFCSKLKFYDRRVVSEAINKLVNDGEVERVGTKKVHWNGKIYIHDFYGPSVEVLANARQR